MSHDIYLVLPEEGNLVVHFLRISTDDAKIQLLEQGMHPSDLREQIEFHDIVGSVRMATGNETVTSRFDECRKKVNEALADSSSELSKAVKEHSFDRNTNGYLFQPGRQATRL